MYVLDASIICDVLLKTDHAKPAIRLITQDDDSLHAPSIVITECLGVARRQFLRGALSKDNVTTFVDDLFSLGLELHDSDQATAHHVTELFDNITASDAAYVVLAAALDAVLVTSDMRLAKASSPRCEVIAFGG